MQTRVSTKGQIVLPGPIRRKLGIVSGDPLDVTVERGRIVLTQVSKPKFEARIVKDPITGFIAINVGPDAPILTSEMVREMLAEFP
jgi:AbrB family looped-hinge helix DNA binding protein